MNLTCTLRLFGRIAINPFVTTGCRLKSVPPSFLQNFSTNKEQETPSLEGYVYDKVCSETLDSLTYYIEEITENATHLGSTDITYGDGVLTIKLGEDVGTYVINKQTPNKQIWLSSPTSGPKRYDFVGPNADKGKWVYKHSGESLHELLQKEFKDILKTDINFFQLPYSK